VVEPYDSDPELMLAAGSADGRVLSDELRRRNLPMFVWTAAICNAIFLAWSGFDLVLVPERWHLFLGFRVIAVAIGSVMAVMISRPTLRRYSFEGFWLLVLVYCASIAPMLGLAGAEFSKYVMGLSVTMIAAGVIPVWHPRWPTTALLASLVVVAVIFSLLWTVGDPPATEVVANSFVLLTAVGIAVIAASFKYDLARRDFFGRVRLAEIARREAEARKVVARTSDDLQTALDKLEKLGRLKNKFFANISHELRTPLTLILAPVSELASMVSTEEAKQQVYVIRRNAERLLGLIDDLLDLSRLDAGGLRLNLAELDLRKVAASVVETSTPAALAGEIDLQLDTSHSNRTIWGDSHRLEIVLTNLITNAIKFTPPGGGIRVGVRDLDDGVRVEVEDTGPGIPEEALGRVFDRFFQVNPADRRRGGGVGIGLALAKELVELHGGTIEAASAENTGTTISIFIPFGRDHIRPEAIERRKVVEPPAARPSFGDVVTPEAVSMPESAGSQSDAPREASSRISDSAIFPAGRRPRVLLVEDNREVRDFIRTLLEPQFEVAVASDGEQGLARVRSDRPDLVVSDVMMPEVSGIELCREIKQDAALRSIPVILLTARVGSEATLDAYAHGADDFVAKPFHPQVLLARIRAQLKLRALALHVAQQEKLAVVGVMSAGILHEVRNPVNAILNASRALASSHLDAGTRSQLLEVIADAAVRIDEITAALDTHARPAESGATGVCDLRAGFEATIKLLRHRLEGVEVHRAFSTELLAQAPAGPMNQVLLNLVDNAVRMGSRSLWIGVEAAGDAVVATVADDGPGVPEEDVERIFDPFFTSRPDGDGTGLGLYLSRRIVEDNGGSLVVEKRSGGGALFRMQVPAVLLDGHRDEPGGTG
jgi:signal transduction histidine kinase